MDINIWKTRILSGSELIIDCNNYWINRKNNIQPSMIKFSDNIKQKGKIGIVHNA